jgi:hypothetical protein
MNVLRAGIVGLCLVGAACSDPSLTAPPASARVDIFDDVWRDFDLNYSFFTLKGIDWDSVRAVYRPRAIAASSDAELARVLGDMLLTLHDRHVSLTTTGRTITYQSQSDLAPTPFDPVLIEQRYLARPGVTAGGHVHYGMASPTVGYVRIPTFEGAGWAGEVDDALGALPDAHALIVDVRDNPGGTTALAADVAGRFTTSAHTFGYVRIRQGPGHDDFTDYIAETVSPSGPKQFDGPLFVLTNRKDYSSAEDFVLAMRTLPQATTVGDTTAGASGSPLVRELPNGWTFDLSTWIEYTPQRTPFENIGLAPAVYVPSTMIDLASGRDPILERAIALASGK